MTKILLKRAYDRALPEDGYRVYVDRLWPRGLSHTMFKYDLWEKGISPSTALREWYHQDPAGRWEDFRRKYFTELASNSDFISFAKRLSLYPVVTLLFSSRDRVHDNARVLARALSKTFPDKFEEVN